MNGDIIMVKKGALVRLSADFINKANAEVDPAAIILQVTTPAGAVSTKTYALAEVSKAAAGRYYYDVDANAVGTWTFRWHSTGAGQAAEEGCFVVAPTAY